MGFSLGIATMVGAAAGTTGSGREVIVLAACIALMAFLVPRSMIGLPILALIGLGAGFGAATVRSPDPIRIAPSSLPTTVDGELASDPRLATFGKSVEVAWATEKTGRRETLLFFTFTEPIGRGDRVIAVGEWSDDQGEVFFADRVEVTSQAGALERFRRKLRSVASDRVLDRTPGSNGSLALGLLIGDDSGLTRSERDELRASGLSHITAVSGSNVALVIVVIAFLLRSLNRIGWVWFSLQVLAIVCYVWIVGPDPPIVRAAIMGSLALLAGVIGRPTHLLTLLALAGAVMTVLAPDTLLTLSFQLSFLAMVGLALAGDIIARTKGLGKKVVAALLSPLGAALLTAPILAAHFGTFSVGSIPANVVVAPLIVPATLLTGVVAILPGGLAVGDAVGSIVWVLTGLILEVSRVVGSSKWAVLTFQPLTNGQTLGLYLVLAIALAPLVPEVRLGVYRLRTWAQRETSRAAITFAAAATSVVALALLVD